MGPTDIELNRLREAAALFKSLTGLMVVFSGLVSLLLVRALLSCDALRGQRDAALRREAVLLADRAAAVEASRQVFAGLAAAESRLCDGCGRHGV